MTNISDDLENNIVNVGNKDKNDERQDGEDIVM